MAAIRWTSEAKKWFKDVYDYIAQDDSKPEKKQK